VRELSDERSGTGTKGGNSGREPPHLQVPASIPEVALGAVHEVLEEGPSSAAQLGFEIRMFEVTEPPGIAPAVEAAASRHPVRAGRPAFHTPPQRLADIALRARTPTMLFAKEVVQAGGLMSFGPDSVELFRRVTVYADKILWGTRPADLPVAERALRHQQQQPLDA
jgi:hypothetical protein